MQSIPLVLASSSPRRRELLASLGVQYEIIRPDVDETPQPGEPPLALVQRLSREKALAAAHQRQARQVVLAADTVVILAADTLGIDERGQVLGKPASAAEARAMLRALRGRAHLVCTAFTLLRADDPHHAHTQVVTTRVHMRDYTDAEIEAYIATGDPFDKAGSYAIQHETFQPVAHIEGSYTNVVGLPVDEVRAALRQWGVLTHA
jgi:septum formation protein